MEVIGPRMYRVNMYLLPGQPPRLFSPKYGIIIPARIHGYHPELWGIVNNCHVASTYMVESNVTVFAASTTNPLPRHYFTVRATIDKTSKSKWIRPSKIRAEALESIGIETAKPRPYSILYPVRETWIITRNTITKIMNKIKPENECKINKKIKRIRKKIQYKTRMILIT